MGRKPKFTRSEAERLLVECGVETLRREGLLLGLAALSLNTALVESGVPRGAAYEIFVDQATFRRAVLVHILLSTPATRGYTMTKNVTSQLLDDFEGSSTPENERDARLALSEIVRDACETNFFVLKDSPDWRLYRSVYAAVHADGKAEEEIKSAAVAGETNLIEAYSHLFQTVANTLGFRLKKGMELSAFTVSVSSLNDGLASRVYSDYEQVVSVHPDGLPGEWTLLAIGFDRIIDGYWEWAGASNID